MSNYTFTDALSYSIAQLAEMVNRSYEQSYLPLQQTPLELARYYQYNNMDMGSTVVMFDRDTFVGTSMLATRDRRGWLGGFGIVPAYRGRGAGKAMLTRQLAVAHAAGLTTLQLEVPCRVQPRNDWAQARGSSRAVMCLTCCWRRMRFPLP